MFSESETQRLVGMLEGHQDVFSSLTVEETREIELQIVGMPNTVQPPLADLSIHEHDRAVLLRNLQELDGFEFRPRDCRVTLRARVIGGDAFTDPAVLLAPDHTVGWAVSLPRLLDPESDPVRTVRFYSDVRSNGDAGHRLSQMIRSVEDLTYAPSMWKKHYSTFLDGPGAASYRRALAAWRVLLEIDKAQDSTRRINEGSCATDHACRLMWYESAQRARCLVKYLEAEARVRETATVMDRNIREAYELNKLLNEFLPYQVISGLLG